MASRNLEKGEIIDDSCIVYKKPGGGLRLDQKSEILKRRLIKDNARASMIPNDDFKLTILPTTICQCLTKENDFTSKILDNDAAILHRI